MRLLNKKEVKKRGCIHCTDFKCKRNRYGYFQFCEHNKCPYNELDKYKSYNDFLEAEENKIPCLDKLLGL